jgi:glycosyltransferase involved in cell wall biosynthesis
MHFISSRDFTAYTFAECSEVKRKILILPSWYPSDSLPVNGIFVQDQAIVLSRHYAVATLVPKVIGWRKAIRGEGRGGSQVELRAGLQVFREVALIPITKGLTSFYYMYHIARHGLEVFDKRIAYYDSYCRAASVGFNRVLARWGKPDMIHAHVVLPAGWAAVNLGKQYHIPVVLTEHSSPFSVHLVSAYQRRLVTKVLMETNRIIAVSPAMAQQIQYFQKDVSPSIVGELVKTDFFSPFTETKENSPDGTITFLSVSLISEQKGIIYLLEAAQHLIKRGYASFELIIGGDGPERSMLEQIAQRFGLSGKCHFTGLLTPDEVRAWMQRCDVFVLPSLHETFGIVLGEAMACGKPVISTRCGGAEFVVTPEVGVLVNVADSVALADAMEGFIEKKIGRAHV